MRPSTTPLESGAEIAGFRVEGLIAEGGMGTVYRATQLRLDREVALKVLSPQRGLDQEFQERFLRESHVAASLKHPNVLPVFDAGEADGVTYLAMLYVEGGDLRDALRQQGRLPVELALEITRQIALALEAAHRAGLVHRDVKPANILLAAEDHAYLADFGLARSQSAPGLTRSGAFMGSPDYVAPEQIEGVVEVDARADIYSLGCVLYHCLAGQPPYGRQSELRAVMAHLDDPTPLLSDVRPDLPDGVSAVAAKAMAKDPAERYPTGADFAAALGDLLGKLRRAEFGDRLEAQSGVVPVATIDQSRRRSAWLRHAPWRRRWAVAGAAALIAAAALVAVLLRGGSSGPAKPLASIARLEKPLPVTAVTVADHSASGGYDRRVSVSFETHPSARRPVTRVEYRANGHSRARVSGTLATTSFPAFIPRLVNGDAYRIQLRACNKRLCSTWSHPPQSVVPFGPPHNPKINSVKVSGASITVGWESQTNGRPVRYLLNLKRQGEPSKPIRLGPGKTQTITVGYAKKGSIVVCAVDSAKAESCSRPRGFVTAPETYRETLWIDTPITLAPGGSGVGMIYKRHPGVQIACVIRVTDPGVNQRNRWWYRIASRPGETTYYARAGAFYNDGRTSGDSSSSPRYDRAVPNCH